MNFQMPESGIILAVESVKAVSMNKNLLLIVTSLATFSASLFSTAVSIALPAIGNEFSMSAQLLGWVVTVFVLATSAVMIPIGRIADIYGQKKVFSGGLLLFMLSSILCAFSLNSIMLICFRIFQGIGAAMIWGPSVAILTSYFAAAERGRAIGINTAAVYCGLSLGPFWGGFLTENLGWRSTFYITVILVVMSAVLAFWKLRGEWAGSRGEKLDVTGSVILTVSLVLSMYGFSTLPGILSIILIVLGLSGLILYYRIEVNKTNPVLDVHLFRNNRVFLFSLIGMLVLYCATFAPVVLLSLYLQYNLEFSPSVAGAMLVIQFAIMAIVAPYSGKISDRVEPLKVAALGMGITCIALLLFSFLTEESTVWFVLTGIIIFGFGFGLFASPVAVAVMSSVDKKDFGVASGTQAAVRHIGQVLSMAIVMVLFAIFIGDVQITPQYYPAFLVSLKTAFLIFAVLCFAGIFFILAGGKVRRDK
jgi:EmrB/QacA subfamily drug resistance transporter